MMRVLVGPLAVFGFVASFVACNGILDIPAASHETTGDGGDTSSSSGDGNACATGDKRCGNACRATDDPAVGCKQTSCNPCNLPNATATCSKDGVCAVLGCAEGFEDCNGEPSDGCEVNTTNDPGNCGGCGSGCDGKLSCVSSNCMCTSSTECGGDDDDAISCDVGSGVCTCFGDNMCQPGFACDLDHNDHQNGQFCDQGQ